MADCLGPLMVIRITEVSLVWRATIERFRCTCSYNTIVTCTCTMFNMPYKTCNVDIVCWLTSEGNTQGPSLKTSMKLIVMHAYKYNHVNVHNGIMYLYMYGMSFLVRCHPGLQYQYSSLGRLQIPPPTPLLALLTLLVTAPYSPWGQSTLKLAIRTPPHSRWNSRTVKSRSTIVYARHIGIISLIVFMSGL